MKFYTYIFVIIVLFLREFGSDGNPELVSESGLENPNPSSIGLIFFIIINNTSIDNDYDVEITPDICCVKDDGGINCNYINIIGGCSDFISKGNVKTLRVAAPLLDIYERKGFCTVFIDSKTNNGPNKRDVLKINFNTTVGNDFKSIGNLNHCTNIDEDPLSDCRPVNCDTYYNGHKSYYSRKYKRCINVPPCVSDDETEYPSVIYNPRSNRCVKESINDRDLEFIKNISEYKEKSRHAKDVLIISKFEPNVTELINTFDLIDNDIRITTLTPSKHRNVSENKQSKKYCFKSLWKKYLIDNKWTLIVLSSVIAIQCFLICTMFYCLSKSCTCFEDKKVVNKFFNYRHDVSVTTPLIDTSNIDIETDYQYLSDTTNNAKQKIKCYKACQKENQNLKTSMSDDILSKCLNRRDWKKFKSQAITEINKDVEIVKGLDSNDIDIPKTERLKKCCESKVVFEDEKTVDKLQKTVVNNTERLEAKNSDDEPNIASEKLIKCHSYNFFDRTELKPTERNARSRYLSKVGPATISTEKGAQVYFSNDSIDDYLSGRGVTYLAGENISKYTFSSDFNDVKGSAASMVSSKTSKNIFKNFMSLLRKQSKLTGTSSDPGQHEDLDIKLIHMSKASVHTSSNDSDNVRTLKRNDSRTSF